MAHKSLTLLNYAASLYQRKTGKNPILVYSGKDGIKRGTKSVNKMTLSYLKIRYAESIKNTKEIKNHIKYLQNIIRHQDDLPIEECQ